MVAGQKKQGKIRAFGHKAGAKSVRRAVSFAANNGIEALTLYALVVKTGTDQRRKSVR
ncbi:undecaprenyl pyrophosphate synthetase [Escherichia coli]|nr:undecaprenyl pyrophosphate synthetase [Escherichia coli]